MEKDHLQRVDLDSGMETLKQNVERNKNNNDIIMFCATKKTENFYFNVDTFAADIMYHQTCYNMLTNEIEYHLFNIRNLVS